MNTLPFSLLAAFSLTLPSSLSASPPSAGPYRSWLVPDNSPIGLASNGEGQLWVLDDGTDRIHGIDLVTGTNHLVATLESGQWRGLAFGEGFLWLAGRTNIYRIDPADLQANPTNTTLVGSPFISNSTNNISNRGLTHGLGLVWVSWGRRVYAYAANTGGNIPLRTFTYDPDDINLSGGVAEANLVPRSLAFKDSTLWMVADTTNSRPRLYELNQFTGDILGEYPFYLGDWWGATYIGDELWVLDRDLYTATRYAYDIANLFSEIFVPTTQAALTGVAEYSNGAPIHGVWDFPYLSTENLFPDPRDPLSYPNCKRVIVSQHGVGSAMEGHFRKAMAAAKEYDPTGVVEKETMVISLLLINNSEVNTSSSNDLFDNTNTFPFITREVPTNFVTWSGGRFVGARHSWNNGVSAFAATDFLLQRAVDLCPNLENIVICGHSGGGQFSQRYAALSTFEDDVARPNGIRMRYVPMNPGAYTYFNEERYVPVANLFGQICDPSGGGILPPYTEEVTWAFPYNLVQPLEKYRLCEDTAPDLIRALNPLSYSRYPLGIHTFFSHDDLFTQLDSPTMRYQYAWKSQGDQFIASGTSPENADLLNLIQTAATAIKTRYARRCVHYTVGSSDVEVFNCYPGNPNDAEPGAGDVFQGCNRYQRARLLFRHIRRVFGFGLTQTHTLAEVPGIGHSSAGMYLSDVVQEYLFGDHCNIINSRISDVAPQIPPDERLPMLDLDQDGQCNLLEIAFNTPPHIASDDGIEAGTHVQVGGAEYLTISYPSWIELSEYRIRPYTSYSLFGPWTEAGVEVSRVSIDAETERVTIRDTEPIGGMPGGSAGRVPERYMRVGVVPARPR